MRTLWDESTPLHKWAAWQASPALVDLLVAKGDNANAQVSPLQLRLTPHACSSLAAWWIDVVKAIPRLGLSRPLMASHPLQSGPSSLPSPALVDLLVAKGADVTARVRPWGLWAQGSGFS